MIVFSSWCKERLRARRPNGLPNEQAPLRAGIENVNFSTLPRSSQLSTATETVPLTSFSTSASNRNSIVTVDESLSDSEEETPFILPMPITGVITNEPRPRNKAVPLSPPRAPTSQISTSQPPPSEAVACQSLLRRTAQTTLNLASYYFSSEKKLGNVQSESCQSEDDVIIDLLIAYSPKLPFLIPLNKKQQRVFEKLSSAQHELCSVEERLRRRQLKLEAYQKAYDYHSGQEVRDLKRMEECSTSNVFLLFADSISTKISN